MCTYYTLCYIDSMHASLELRIHTLWLWITTLRPLLKLRQFQMSSSHTMQPYQPQPGLGSTIIISCTAKNWFLLHVAYSSHGLLSCVHVLTPTVCSAETTKYQHTWNQIQIRAALNPIEQPHYWYMHNNNNTDKLFAFQISFILSLGGPTVWEDDLQHVSVLACL